MSMKMNKNTILALLQHSGDRMNPFMTKNEKKAGPQLNGWMKFEK